MAVGTVPLGIGDLTNQPVASCLSKNLVMLRSRDFAKTQRVFWCVKFKSDWPRLQTSLTEMSVTAVSFAGFFAIEIIRFPRR